MMIYLSRTLLTASFFSTSKQFKIRLKKVNEPEYFIQIINNPHPLKQSNRMLNGVRSGSTGITKANFESIFKKYVYYICQIRKGETYKEASIGQKLFFLENITSIYANLGKISASHLLKTFNKISTELLNDSSLPLGAKLKVIRNVSLYNDKRASALFLSLKNKFLDPRFLQKIDQQIALTILQIGKNTAIFHRLLVESAIDALINSVADMNLYTLGSVAYSLGSSHYPINKTFILKIIKRLKFLMNTDFNIGMPLIRERMHLMNGLSMIQKNMKLASAYLPELDSIYEVNIHLFMSNLQHMKNYDFMSLSNFLRRIYFYNTSSLEAIADESMKRQILQLSQQNTQKSISINVLCSILHAFAAFNYRNKKYLDYIIKAINLIFKIPELREKLQYKFYGRIIWSVCVLGNKQELSSLYPLVQSYFSSKKNHKTFDLRNFYYIYLLLKSYFPTITLSFDRIQKTIQDQQQSASLVSSISLTHDEIYNQFVEAGVPCLKEYNISNLMCDIFIPEFTCRKTNKTLKNVIVDVHGYYHFMRNMQVLKGGSSLKKKILEEEGYVYQYITIDQWGMVADKKDFILYFMEQLVEKYGKKPKLEKLQQK